MASLVARAIQQKIVSARVSRVSSLARARLVWRRRVMRHDPTDIICDSRITVSVPTEMRGAVERAANAQAITVADFTRAALSDRLTQIGVPHSRVPPLRRARP
jgi:hypothetical protein